LPLAYSPSPAGKTGFRRALITQQADGETFMNWPIWRWRLHRNLVDRAGLLWPFANNGRKRCLFISERDPICHTQLFPYFFHVRDFASRQGFDLRELPLRRFLKGWHPYKTQVDAVCFQTWFDLSREDFQDLIQRIQTQWPDAKIAYFDWFAPTDLRFAETLDKSIAAYVKKQSLKDPAQYQKPTLGDTNLTDYYARSYKLDLPETLFTLPEGFLDKLFLSPHFAFSDHMLPYFLKDFPDKQNCTIDLHARIAIKGTQWYSLMRHEALMKVTALEKRLNVVCNGRVSRDEYFKELFNAKLCFSPFGYGEVCWRDFEAMFTGSLLLKPDMGHVACYPDTFIPYETYVPLNWDLSDFDEKVDYYLNHAEERERIARNAFNLLKTYFQERRFLDDVRPLLTRLGLDAQP
jgi:glycosyltransferase involved in cell wall biosynthesis